MTDETLPHPNAENDGDTHTKAQYTSLQEITDKVPELFRVPYDAGTAEAELKKICEYLLLHTNEIKLFTNHHLINLFNAADRRGIPDEHSVGDFLTHSLMSIRWGYALAQGFSADQLTEVVMSKHSDF